MYLRICLPYPAQLRWNFGCMRGMLSAAAREAGADIAVYGHTHTALEERGDVTVLNPGSIARPRDERRGSFMLVELHEYEVPQVELLRIR